MRDERGGQKEIGKRERERICSLETSLEIRLSKYLFHTNPLLSRLVSSKTRPKVSAEFVSVKSTPYRIVGVVPRFVV